MKILLAPDSFKESLPAVEVARALKSGIERVLPDASLRLLPVADGGEGTVQAIVDATNGKIIEIKVHDPLMRLIDSFYGIAGNGQTAVIEMAAASGLSLLALDERNPWITTTVGTGELIKAAMDKGCTRILLGIGGSATNDGGAGMASALGVKFLNDTDKEITPVGGNLDQIERIDTSLLDKRICSTDVSVACDVVNPLTGPEGASYTYGPQKGASTEMVLKLEKNLKHFSAKINEYLSRDVDTVPGAGAAGGLGAGLMAFLDARLMGGFEMVARAIGLEKEMAESDLVITGEGKIDAQTWYGKAVAGVTEMAKKYNKPVVAVAGVIDKAGEVTDNTGIKTIFQITEQPIPLQESIRNASSLLTQTGERIGEWIIKEKFKN